MRCSDSCNFAGRKWWCGSGYNFGQCFEINLIYITGAYAWLIIMHALLNMQMVNIN